MAFRRRSSAPDIEMDDDGLRRHLAGHKVAQVRWDELTRLDIRVAVSQGRVQPEWVMTGRTGDEVTFLMPDEPEGFLARVQTLPGFHCGRFTSACKATHESTYTCWDQTLPNA